MGGGVESPQGINTPGLYTMPQGDKTPGVSTEGNRETGGVDRGRERKEIPPSHPGEQGQQS